MAASFTLWELEIRFVETCLETSRKNDLLSIIRRDWFLILDHRDMRIISSFNGGFVNFWRKSSEELWMLLSMLFISNAMGIKNVVFFQKMELCTVKRSKDNTES